MGCSEIGERSKINTCRKIDEGWLQHCQVQHQRQEQAETAIMNLRVSKVDGKRY